MGSLNPISENQISLITAITDMTANALQRQSLYENLQTQLENVQNTQARLLESEKLAALGELIAGVAHELNNPLTSVILNAQMLQHDNLDTEPTQQIEQIISGAQRAARIVRNLLDFARQKPIERKPTQVNNVIRHSIDLTANELRLHNIQWELDLLSELPPTLIDPAQLEQVIINLINNAWQAISTYRDHGLIKISSQIAPSTFLGRQPGAPVVSRDPHPGSG